jgi:hypothetical protein
MKILLTIAFLFLTNIAFAQKPHTFNISSNSHPIAHAFRSSRRIHTERKIDSLQLNLDVDYEKQLYGPINLFTSIASCETRRMATDPYDEPPMAIIGLAYRRKIDFKLGIGFQDNTCNKPTTFEFSLIIPF